MNSDCIAEEEPGDKEKDLHRHQSIGPDFVSRVMESDDKGKQQLQNIQRIHSFHELTTLSIARIEKARDDAPLPSPLGRVAQRSQVGRGSPPPCFWDVSEKWRQRPLPSALRAPKGKARRRARQRNYRAGLRLRKILPQPAFADGFRASPIINR